MVNGRTMECKGIHYSKDIYMKKKKSMNLVESIIYIMIIIIFAFEILYFTKYKVVFW